MESIQRPLFEANENVVTPGALIEIVVDDTEVILMQPVALNAGMVAFYVQGGVLHLAIHSRSGEDIPRWTFEVDEKGHFVQTHASQSAQKAE